VGVGTEAADLDFKETLDPKANGFMVELGKDLAALANTLGGHIVIGASTELNRTRCTGFHGLSRDLGADLAGHFERAAKDRCRPTPFISTQLTDIPGDAEAKVVLVIRVEPSAIAPVGASVEQHQGGKLVDQAWVFPYRVGSQTEYLTPDQFGAFESMTARRAAALLDTIPLDQRRRVSLCWRSKTGSREKADAALEGIDARRNLVSFQPDGPGAPALHLPLDAVSTVWPVGQGGQERWTIVVRGHIRLVGPTTFEPLWDYDPIGMLE
jgi:hypothetical protein